MAAITTRTITKDKPKSKPAPNPELAKSKLMEIANYVGPKSEAKRLLDEALGLLQ